METRCSKVIFPKYSKKRNRLKIRSYRRYGEHGEKKNVRFSRIVFSRCCTCTRRNYLRFHVENCQHPDQKQLTRRLAFDLDIEATHRQPASCRARPVNVDDGLEDIRWNTVTRGWVGAPNGRAPFRFHGAVVVFFARCLSRTRNLAASNKHLAEFLRPPK